ncbi:hypothetical protein [uncultured Mediterranean phage uvMED]|nr:hypothetical protein [uncultured Mediterranean phage uvMED]BAR22554.1 hypothetical protein [uncultured Mediterranean phage uvMED]
MGAPVNNTCPDIDKVIKGIEEAEKLSSDFYTNFQDKKVSDIEEAFQDIANALFRLTDTMEDLRSANSSLRDWGESTESYASDLLYQIDELKG